MTTGKPAYVPTIETDDRPRPAYMAHVVLRTRDKARLRRWYELVLGAQLVFENAKITFMTFDGEHHRIALVEAADALPAQPNTVGVLHYAYSLHSLDDLIANYKHLKAAGIMPVRTVNHGTTTSLYYADPDGNTVETQVDNFPDLASLNAWYATGHFTENPIGIEFDFEDLVALRDSGVSAEDIRRPWSDNPLTSKA